jgi:hypothetical protein
LFIVSIINNKKSTAAAGAYASAFIIYVSKRPKSQKSLIIQALALFCSICGKIGQKMETLYKKSIRHLLCGTQMKMPRPGATSA